MSSLACPDRGRWVCWVVVGVMAMLLLMSRESTASPQQLVTSTFQADQAPSDVIFTSDVIWEGSAVSTLACAVRCVEDPQCAMFTHSPTGWGAWGSGAGNVSCRVHSKLQAVGDAQNPSPGARSFSRDVPAASPSLPSACETSDDCTLPLTACFSGTCLCDGGRFYETSLDTCVNACAQSLGDIYHAYQHMDITLNNAGTQQGDVDTCKAVCTADENCKAFTFLYGWCYFKHITALDDPAAWVEAIGVVYYQRTCA